MHVRRRRGSMMSAGALAAALMLASCTADPPPPIEQVETTTPPAPPAQRSTMVMAIDGFDTGFNPHLLADQSPVSNAVAEMVLPSAFRAVPNPENPAVTDWVPDESVLVSAEVTSEAPFVVTYRLRTDAQWSDSAPIAAEDFHYLWRQMVTQPGVVDPAGYRLIEDVQSSEGGKTVTVSFREAYPAWRELFTHMLPAHLVKDTPGGFATAMSESLPLSGGRFKMESVDRGRGEIVLERNDRFWGEPAVPDEILMRRGGSDTQITDSMRTGDTQIVQVRSGAALTGQLDAVQGVRTAVQLQPRTLEMTLNARVPALADVAVRRAVLDLLDPALLGLVATGTESALVPDLAQVFSPSSPGYEPSAPARPGRDETLARLGDAGYLPSELPVPVVGPETGNSETAEPLPPGTLVRDGVPLTLTLGVVEGSATPLAVARTAADLLRGAGIAATVRQMPSGELYGEALADGSVDAVVGWMRAGGDPATVALSRFGCPPAPPPLSPSGGDPAEEAATEGSGTDDSGTSTGSAPGPESGESTTDAESGESTTDAESGESTTDAESGESVDDLRDDVEAAAAAPSNLSGVCDPTLQADLDAAFLGSNSVETVLDAAQPRLWDLAVTLPILQDRTVVAARPEMVGVSLFGAVPAGIVGDAHTWWRPKS